MKIDYTSESANQVLSPCYVEAPGGGDRVWPGYITIGSYVNHRTLSGWYGQVVDIDELRGVVVDWLSGPNSVNILNKQVEDR